MIKKIPPFDIVEAGNMSVLIWENDSNNFGSFRIRNKEYLLGWNGKGIPTELKLKDYNLHLIGVNQRAIVIDDYGVVKFSIGLFSEFQFFLEAEFGFGIICEIGIILVDAKSFSIRRNISISDIIVDCKILDDDKLEIETLDETIII